MPKVKRLNKTIHPNSRKALQLASKEHRKQRTIKSHNDTKTKKGVLIRKILWFRDQIVPKDGDEESMQTETYSESKFDEFRKKEKEVFTVDEIKSLIELYFQRFDAEIDQINTKKAIGNRNIGQHFSREKAIEITLENEKHEYETVGLEVPDLTIPKMVAFIRNWNGQANVLPAIKLKTIKKQ